MPSLLLRVHEYAAERLPWVQFPRQQLIPATPRAPLFKYQMPLWKRFALAIFGLAALVVCLALLAALALLLYATFSVVFASGR